MDWPRRWDASGREIVWRLFSILLRIQAVGLCGRNLAANRLQKCETQGDAGRVKNGVVLLVWAGLHAGLR